MGVMQKALETYDAMAALAGVYEENREPLSPIGHIVTRAEIEITIDAEGHFVEVQPAQKDLKIIIPVTEKSAGRTNSPAPHALCERLSYLLGNDAEKFKLYVDGLKQWVASEYTHPKAEAVLKYVSGRTMAADLAQAAITAKTESSMVCWRVIGLGDGSGPVWTDMPLMKAYQAYYISQKAETPKVCMLTGEETFAACQHLKGVFSNDSNAKIISANDSSDFTYRGRFIEPEEALTVGYIASQKAHNALKWIISNQGTVQGDRVFVCWNPQGYAMPRPMPQRFRIIPFIEKTCAARLPDIVKTGCHQCRWWWHPLMQPPPGDWRLPITMNCWGLIFWSVWHTGMKPAAGRMISGACIRR